jgi:hypothetical protein
MRKLLLAAVTTLIALSTVAAIEWLVPSPGESPALPGDLVSTGDRQPEVEMNSHPDLQIDDLFGLAVIERQHQAHPAIRIFPSQRGGELSEQVRGAPGNRTSAIGNKCSSFGAPPLDNIIVSTREWIG